jgi:hypothetical protein
MAVYKEMKTIKFPNSDVVYVITDDEKIEKNQGVENAGKVLGVGEDGLVALIDIETPEVEMPDGILTYTEQTLTEEQRTQARTNIGAGTSDFSGNYEELTGKPDLFSGDYNDLSNKPSLFSGSYNDLTDKPVISSIDIDSALSANSTNPVQNKVVYSALSGKAPTTHNHTKSQITDFPDSLKNPKTLTFTGASTGSYDGSSAVTINIPTQSIYDLPMATNSTLGGVKPVAKTSAMTQDVGVDSTGKLYVAPATVDSAMSSTSANPVQNKVVYIAISDAKSYTDTKISNLINGAPTTLDTLGEIAAAMEENEDVVAALDTAVGKKANASDLTSHTGNTSNPHGVTAVQVGAVPTTRTVNGKALSSNITLSASDVGADVSGAAESALTNAKAYTDSAIATAIANAIGGSY